MVERFVDLPGMPVHTFSGVRDQVRECVETPWLRTSPGADGRVRLFGINGSAIFGWQLATRPKTLVLTPFGRLNRPAFVAQLITQRVHGSVAALSDCKSEEYQERAVEPNEVSAR